MRSMILAFAALLVATVVMAKEPTKTPVKAKGAKGSVKPLAFPKLKDIKPEVKQKAEALILQLGAESFKDRKKARKELEALGPSIIPLLKLNEGHEEPEVRDAIPGLLTALYDKLTVTIPDLKITLMPIKAGSFQMGSTSGDSDDKPVHKVTLTQPFWMGRTEVTQSQYQSIMGKSPSKFSGRDNPVEQVSWNECVEFCKKLTTRERKAGRLPAGQQYRLPTEAEWEYCCRAGSDTKYSFGDGDTNLGDYAWYDKNSGSKTHPVAGKKPNAWGLYDMHGNVWEWCSNRFGNYPSGAQTNPTGAQSGSLRVFRGGGWSNFARGCRSADRSGIRPTGRSSNLGFRLVRASRP